MLVTIDTLRADHLGAYGYPRATSPFIDDLAKRGALFENAFSSSATTGPAHATLFTGLPPLVHGVRSNHQRLRASLSTLADHMAAAGYETAAFVGINTHFLQSDLGRGFQAFDRPVSVNAGHAKTGRDKTGSGSTDSGSAIAIRSGAETNMAVRSWLAAREARPLFLWVHYFDPHAPYRAPPFRSPDGAADHARFLVENRGMSLDLFSEEKKNLLELIDAYDGEVAAADAALRGLYAEVERAYSDVRMLWFVTSDHGEGLGSHGWPLHGSRLYDEQLRVPLIVHDTGGSLDGLRIDALVAHADVFASLLEVAGRDAPADPASGTSFVPLLRGEQWTGRRYAFSERRYFAPGASGSIKPVAGLDREPRKLQAPMPFSIEALFREGYRNAFDPGEKYALQDERYKYIHHTLYGDELYDLVHDPLELENLIGRGLPEEKRLLEELLSSVRALTRRGGDATSIDRESFEALEALGYVE